MHVLEDSAIFSSLQEEQDGIKGNVSGRRERRAFIRNSFLVLLAVASCVALVRTLMEICQSNSCVYIFILKHVFLFLISDDPLFSLPFVSFYVHF